MQGGLFHSSNSPSPRFCRLPDLDFANDDNLTITPGLKRYHELYLKQGEEAQVNDGDLIRDALSIAFYKSQGLPATTKWDPAGLFQSRSNDDAGGDCTEKRSDEA